MVKIVFFAKVVDPALLERNEFYAVDLRILREMGHEITVCTDPLRIPKADLYFVWWWTWAIFPLLRARLLGAPVVVVGVFDHVLPDGRLSRFPSRPAVHRLAMRSVLRGASANLVTSSDQFEALRTRFRVRGLRVVPCAIDTSLYAVGSGEREPFVLSFCWMHAGNAFRKCIPELIIAFSGFASRRDGYRLLICGEHGSDYPALRQMVADHDLIDRVEFPGVVSRQQKIDLMQRCSLYLQPTREEGFGVAILEAMSCGACVIASPAGAVPEVAGDTVVMVDGTDPVAIGDRMEELLQDEARRASLGQRAGMRARSRFDYVVRRQAISEIVSSLL